MNILITNLNGLGYGGAEITIHQFAEGFKKRGHNVIIASSGEFNSLQTEKIMPILHYPYVLRNLYFKRRFIDIIKKYSIDIINPQDSYTLSSAINAAKSCSIPIVINIRDYWFACPRSSCLMPDYTACIHCNPLRLLKCSKWHRYLLDLYKWINIKKIWHLIDTAGIKIVASNTLKQKLSDCGISKNIIVMPVARKMPDKSLKNIRGFKKRLGLKKIVVTFIGSFFYTKGVLKLFEFMPAVLQNNPGVSLLIVGDGPLYNELVSKIKKAGIENQVVLTGRLSYEKIPLCYAASDIILIPHQWSEPFGAIMLEAAAMGKPSILSDKGGSAEFGKLFGYVITSTDSAEWKRKVLYLINHPDARKSLGRKAKINSSMFSMDNFADETELIFKGVINSSLK